MPFEVRPSKYLSLSSHAATHLCRRTHGRYASRSPRIAIQYLLAAAARGPWNTAVIMPCAPSMAAAAAAAWRNPSLMRCIILWSSSDLSRRSSTSITRGHRASNHVGSRLLRSRRVAHGGTPGRARVDGSTNVANCDLQCGTHEEPLSCVEALRLC